MIELVISGGQSGADQSGWRAAKVAGIATGGWCPKGFKTEDGPRPEFAELYGAKEHASPDYPPRTRANIEWCDGTMLFGDPNSRGSKLALSICDQFATPKPVYFVIDPIFSPAGAARWVDLFQIKTLNCAGNRESAAPGIGAWAEAFLAKVFAITNGEGRR